MELYFRVQIRGSVNGIWNMRFKLRDRKGIVAGHFGVTCLLTVCPFSRGHRNKF
jgi:hypothetical protein